MSNMFTMPLDESMAQIVRCAVALAVIMGLYAFLVIWLSHYLGKNTAGFFAVRAIAALVSLPVSSVATHMALRFYPAIGEENAWVLFFGCLVGSAVLALQLSRPAIRPSKPTGVI